MKKDNPDKNVRKVCQKVVEEKWNWVLTIYSGKMKHIWRP